MHVGLTVEREGAPGGNEGRDGGWWRFVCFLGDQLQCCC